MPAFDPVRDAVLNSPVSTFQSPFHQNDSIPSPTSTRRATDLASLLNDNSEHPARPRRSTLSYLLLPENAPSTLISDDTLLHSAPLRRSIKEEEPLLQKGSPYISRNSPDPPSASPLVPSPHNTSQSSTSLLPPATPMAVTESPKISPPPSKRPYNPTKRVTPAGSVLVPMSEKEMTMYRDYSGQGAERLVKRKRQRSAEPEDEQPPTKKLAGDVGVVVSHCT
jgi:hypothetical protein